MVNPHKWFKYFDWLDLFSRLCRCADMQTLLDWHLSDYCWVLQLLRWNKWHLFKISYQATESSPIASFPTYCRSSHPRPEHRSKSATAEQVTAPVWVNMHRDNSEWFISSTELHFCLSMSNTCQADILIHVIAVWKFIWNHSHSYNKVLQIELIFACKFKLYSFLYYWACLLRKTLSVVLFRGLNQNQTQQTNLSQ